MTKKSQRVRLDMRFPQDLLEWAKRHAKKKRVTTTQLFIECIVHLKEAANGR